MKTFLDSSALVKRYIREDGTDDLPGVLAAATALGVSAICLPEVISAFSRLSREGLLTRAQYNERKSALLSDLSAATVINLSPAVLNRSTGLLEAHTLRTLDALHVATALEWGAERFVSADKRQAAAARAGGLKVQLIPAARA